MLLHYNIELQVLRNVDKKSEVYTELQILSIF